MRVVPLPLASRCTNANRTSVPETLILLSRDAIQVGGRSKGDFNREGREGCLVRNFTNLNHTPGYEHTL